MQANYLVCYAINNENTWILIKLNTSLLILKNSNLVTFFYKKRLNRIKHLKVASKCTLLLL
jgi:hypothetical protein